MKTNYVIPKIVRKSIWKHIIGNNKNNNRNNKDSCVSKTSSNNNSIAVIWTTKYNKTSKQYYAISVSKHIMLK